jgi:outer membrane protein assembly factor BamB
MATSSAFSRTNLGWQIGPHVATAFLALTVATACSQRGEPQRREPAHAARPGQPDARAPAALVIAWSAQGPARPAHHAPALPLFGTEESVPVPSCPDQPAPQPAGPRCSFQPTSTLELGGVTLWAGMRRSQWERDGMYGIQDQVVLVRPTSPDIEVLHTVTQWDQDVSDCQSTLRQTRRLIADLDRDGSSELCIERITEVGEGLAAVLARADNGLAWQPIVRRRELVAWRMDAARMRLERVSDLDARCPASGYQPWVPGELPADPLAARALVQGPDAPTAGCPLPPWRGCLDIPECPAIHEEWPVANLRPVAVLAAPPRQASLSPAGARDDLVAALGTGEVAIYRPGDPFRLATGQHRSAGFPLGSDARVAGDLLVGTSSDGHVVAAHVLNGSVAWSTSLSGPHPDGQPVAVPAALLDAWSEDDAVIAWLSTRGSTSTTMLVGIERASGRVQWQRDVTASAVTMAGDRVIVLGSATLSALDARSGQVVWRRADAAPASAESDDAIRVLGTAAYVLVNRPHAGVDVLDTRSGDLLRRLPGSGTAAGLPWLVDGRDLFQVRWEPARGAWTLLATDLATGHRRWAGQPFEFVATPTMVALSADADAVYGCTPGGRLLAWDRATGAVRWQHGIGRCRGFAAVRDPGDDTALVAQDARGTILVFQRGPAPPGPRAVEITGTLRVDGAPGAGRQVQIADRVVRTDATGQFRVAVDTPGLVRIEAAVAPDRETTTPQVIDTTAPPGQPVQLAVTTCDRACD